MSTFAQTLRFARRVAAMLAGALALVSTATAAEPEARPSAMRPPRDAAAYSDAVHKLQTRPAAELFAFAAYKGKLPKEEAAEAVKLGGATTRMAVLHIGEPQAAVFQEYRETISRHAPLAQAGQLPEGAAYFAFRDPADGFMRTLTLMREGSGTTVLAAVADPARLEEKGNFPADFPMPPQAEKARDMEFGSGSGLQQTRYAQIPGRTPEQVIAFYRKELPPLGWKPEADSEIADKKVSGVSFARGQEHCTITAASARSGCGLSIVCVGGRN